METKEQQSTDPASIVLSPAQRLALGEALHQGNEYLRLKEDEDSTAANAGKQALQLSRAYLDFRGTTEEEQQGERDLSDAKRKLTEKQNAIIREKGDELGSNATARAASLEALCEEETKRVQSLERQLQELKHARQLASIDLDLQRDLLRCLEIQAGRR